MEPSEGREKKRKRREGLKLDDVPSLKEYENLITSLKRDAMKKPVIENVLPLVVAVTGCRISECLELTTADIDYENSVLYLKTLKGGKGRKRVVPVPSWLLAILENYILFNGIGYKLFPISRAHAWRIVKSRTGLRPHALRHAFAMYLLYKGLDPETVRRILGHARWSVVAYYVSSVRIDKSVRSPLETI